MGYRERFARQAPLEAMEVALVRAALAQPSLIDAHEEAVLRTALSLARLYKVSHQGREVGVGAWLSPWREAMERRLGPVLGASSPPSRATLLPALHGLKAEVLATREALEARFASRLPASAIDRELREKALVLVLGGGGGTAYVYAGAMGLLDAYGLKPRLLAATSMGAILALFRSRMPRFEQSEIVNIVRALSWRKLFRVISAESRYGVPAALRLFLRSGIGRWFGHDGPGEGVTLGELPVRTLITVSGIRRGRLPHPLEFYERLFRVSPRDLMNPLALSRAVVSTFTALAELVNRPEVLVKLHLGGDALTAGFDAVDAAGFSSALPGVIHYDVLRHAPRMHGLLEALLAQHRVSRLVDGGLVDNVPARAAWQEVHSGSLGTRNAFILALNGFSMKLTTPLWLALERLAERNVAGNRKYAHLFHDFKHTLSPLELVPGVELLTRAIALGQQELEPQMPLVARMLAPLPRLLR